MVYSPGNNVIKKYNYTTLFMRYNVYSSKLNNKPFSECEKWIARMYDVIAQAHFTTKPQFKNANIANFIVDEFPKQQRWKEYPRGNNMKVPEVWENFLEVNFERVTSSWIRLIDQHDTSLGQRKNRNRQESNPWPPEILDTALTNDLRELAESKVIYLSSYTTSVLYTQTNPSRTPVKSELLDSIHLWHFFYRA